MIESAEIQNFRLFERAEISGLSRVNIVVGDNSAGKTTLLEALYASASTSIDVGTKLRVWRGMEPTVAGSPQDIYDSIFLNIFHKFDRGRLATVTTKGTAADTRQVRIFYDTGQPEPLPLEPPRTGTASLTTAQAYIPVVFEWTDFEGVVARSTLQMRGTNIIPAGNAQRRGGDPTFLAARAPFNAVENGRWFSELKKAGKERGFVKAIRDQFKEIADVSTETDMGAFVLHVRHRWSKQFVPISLVSDGMNKIATVLLHIAHSEGTVTFFDEVENGVHFSRHELMWRQMRESGREYQTQIFASTHSLECLRAVLPVIKAHPQDFTLVRAYRKRDTGSATIISGKEAVAVIESGLEVRE